MKLLICSLMLSIAVLTLLGCGGEAPDSEQITIAVIPKGLTHEFWKSIHAGAIKAQHELGVEIIWQGPEKEDDRQQQITVVQNMILRGVSGIVLAPLDDKALRGPVAEATGKKIPVVIIDSGLDSDQHVSFVATDNRRGGALAGEHMGKLLDGSGKVIVLRYQEGSASTHKREEGFIAAAKAAGLEIVSAEQYAGATPETAQNKSDNLLLRFTENGKLAVDGIFCPNESSTAGMLLSLRQSGHVGTVKFIGFDASPPLVGALADGDIAALVVQDPMKMGYLGVKTMVAHLRGEQTAAVIDTGAVLVTGQNMDLPQMHELLHPDLDKWLK